MISNICRAPNMLPCGYGQVDTCINCAHAVQPFCPEGWEGYCNFAKDMPPSWRLREDDGLEAVASRRSLDWEMLHYVQSNHVCDYHERGKPEMMER